MTKRRIVKQEADSRGKVLHIEKAQTKMYSFSLLLHT